MVPWKQRFIEKVLKMEFIFIWVRLHLKIGNVVLSGQLKLEHIRFVWLKNFCMKKLTVLKENSVKSTDSQNNQLKESFTSIKLLVLHQ